MFRKEEMIMKRLVIYLAVFLVLPSCALTQRNPTLAEIKADLTSLVYQEGMAWRSVSQTLGPPDQAPLPEPGTDLSRNSRLYQDMTVIFYTTRQEFREDGKVRFKEVVDRVEIGKRK